MHRAVLTQEHEFHMVNGKLFITSETDPDKQVALSVKERVGNIRLIETGIHITKKAQWMIGRPTNVGYASQAHRAKRRSRQDLNLRPTDPQSVALSTELRDHMTVFVIESIPVHATCVKYSRAKIFWGCSGQQRREARCIGPSSSTNSPPPAEYNALLCPV